MSSGNFWAKVNGKKQFIKAGDLLWRKGILMMGKYHN